MQKLLFTRSTCLHGDILPQATRVPVSFRAINNEVAFLIMHCLKLEFEIRLVELRSAIHLNSREGVIRGVDTAHPDRWKARLDDGTYISVKAENVMHICRGDYKRIYRHDVGHVPGQLRTCLSTCATMYFLFLLTCIFSFYLPSGAAPSSPVGSDLYEGDDSVFVSPSSWFYKRWRIVFHTARLILSSYSSLPVSVITQTRNTPASLAYPPLAWGVSASDDEGDTKTESSPSYGSDPAGEEGAAPLQVVTL